MLLGSLKPLPHHQRARLRPPSSDIGRHSSSDVEKCGEDFALPLTGDLSPISGTCFVALFFRNTPTELDQARVLLSAQGFSFGFFHDSSVTRGQVRWTAFECDPAYAA